MKIVTVAEMVAVEQAADASGHTYAEMMEHAGRNLAEAILEIYPYLEEESALALVGKGNNGGDALVALTYMAQAEWRVTAYLTHDRGDDPLVQRVRDAGGEILLATGEADDFPQLRSALGNHDLLVDGVLGTGFQLPLRGKLRDILHTVKQTLTVMSPRPKVVAVDCPSGVDCDSGAVAPETLPADLTVTMAAAKAGMFQFPAHDYLGELELAAIGLPEGLAAWVALQRTVVDEEWVEERLPRRPRDAHKGTFGTALVVAGSVNYTGAALLAGKGAYRAGAGLVTLAVPSVLHGALAGHFPEATWLLLPNELGVISKNAVGLLRDNLARVTALAIGPGFGLEETTGDFLAALLTPAPRTGRAKIGFVRSAQLEEGEPPAALPPLVVDADGLKLLAGIEDWPAKLPAPAVLTPHPGEMSVLTGLSKGEVQADRVGVAERFARAWGHVVVLKGAFTLVAAPDGRTAMVPVASAALARAGTGDVLAGAIAGLLAQGMEAFEAAAVGAWVHAQAGLHAAEVLGSARAVLAGDVLDALVDVLGALEGE